MNHQTPTYCHRLGFFNGEAMSPYLFRLFSQNVKNETMHPEIIGAIMLTNIKLMISPPPSNSSSEVRRLTHYNRIFF